MNPALQRLLAMTEDQISSAARHIATTAFDQVYAASDEGDQAFLADRRERLVQTLAETMYAQLVATRVRFQPVAPHVQTPRRVTPPRPAAPARAESTREEMRDLFNRLWPRYLAEGRGRVRA